LFVARLPSKHLFRSYTGWSKTALIKLWACLTLSVGIRACVQLRAYADNVALPAFARRTPLLSAGRAAIDRYLLPAGPTAAILQQRVCCCGPMLRQTDRRTLYRYLDPAFRDLRAVPIKPGRCIVVSRVSSVIKISGFVRCANTKIK